MTFNQESDVFTDSDSYEALPPGVYRASLTSVTVREVDFGEGPERRASWMFHISEEHAGGFAVDLEKLTGLSVGNARAMATRIVVALGLPGDVAPHSSQLVGRTVDLVLATNPKGYTTIESFSPVVQQP